MTNGAMRNERSFCRAKEIISRVKRHPTKWEKVITNYNSGMELISGMYTNYKLKHPKIFQSINELMS